MPSSPNALITGASRGIGRAIADRLASQGYNLTITARSQEDVDKIARTLRDTHKIKAHAFASDLGDPTSLSNLIASHIDTFGTMHALVLNAGMGMLGGVERLDHDKFQHIFQINFTSALQLFQEALPSLRSAIATDPTRGARIIALSSILGVHSQQKLGGYAASKAALRSLVETINLEHSVEGISATAICPAYVATDMTSWLNGTITPESMLIADDLAEVTASLLKLSPQAVVKELVVSRAGTDGRIP